MGFVNHTSYILPFILTLSLMTPTAANAAIGRTVIYRDSEAQRTTVKENTTQNGYKGKTKVFTNSDPITALLGKIFSIAGVVHGDKDQAIEAFRGFGPNFKGSADKLLAIQHTAFALSEEICGIPWEERRSNPHSVGFSSKLDKNETDAIRHFTVSALLTIEFGLSNSRMLMTARESKASVPTDNLMDLYNNDLGFQAGLSILESKKSMNLSPADVNRRIKQEALRLLHQGQFSVLLSGGDRATQSCTLPKLYPNEKHLTVDLANHFLLENGIPKVCRGSAFDLCRDRTTMRGLIFCLSKSMNREKSRLRRLIPGTAITNRNARPVRTRNSDRTSDAHKLTIRRIENCQRSIRSLVRFFEKPRDVLSYPEGELPKELQTPSNR